MIRAGIDAAALTGREDLHNKLAAGLELPPWYGRNLDALWDCLTEPGEERVLLIVHPEALEERLGRYGVSFLRLLKEAEEENAGFRFELLGKEGEA